MSLEFHLGLSSLQNGDFETGDFTGWDQRSGSISSENPHLGNYCAEVEASGADIGGLRSDAIPINLNDFYNIICWNQVDSLDVGVYYARIVNYSDIAGNSYISYIDIVGHTEIVDWTKSEKSISGSGSGADLIFPNNTQSIRIDHRWWNAGGNPQGLARMDDVIFANLVQLYPEYDYKGGEIQLRNQMRTPSGKGYLYKHGDYDKFQFTVNYLPGSSAAIVNSWWDTNAKLLFLITSGTITEVHSVILMNKDTPFQQFNKPYADKLKGKVLLEGY